MAAAPDTRRERRFACTSCGACCDRALAAATGTPDSRETLAGMRAEYRQALSG